MSPIAPPTANMSPGESETRVRTAPGQGGSCRVARRTQDPETHAFADLSQSGATQDEEVEKNGYERRHDQVWSTSMEELAESELRCQHSAHLSGGRRMIFIVLQKVWSMSGMLQH